MLVIVTSNLENRMLVSRINRANEIERIFIRIDARTKQNTTERRELLGSKHGYNNYTWDADPISLLDIQSFLRSNPILFTLVVQAPAPGFGYRVFARNASTRNLPIIAWPTIGRKIDDYATRRCTTLCV